MLKFSIGKGVPILKATINGKGVKLLIDTGANSSLIDYALRKRLNFAVSKSDKVLHGAGGKVQMYNTFGCEVIVDGEPLDIKMKAMNFENIRGALGVSGVIGSDFLIKNKLKINFETKCLE